MKKGKQFNEFRVFVSQGDWNGYKDLVSKKNHALYVELKSKIPLLERVDKLCTSKVKRKRIYGNVIFTFYLLLIFGLTFIITDNQLIQCILFAITPIFNIQIPLLFILLRQERMSKTKTWFFLMPRGIAIVVKHVWYMCEILGMFLWKNRTQKGALLIYIFRVVSWSYTISSVYTFVVYWLFKDLQFKNLFHLWLFLIPLAFLSVWVNHYLGYKEFLSKLKFVVLNKRLTYLFFFLMSFITFFALLQLNIDYSGYKALKIKGIVLVYSCVLIFIELAFSDKHYCYQCGKEINS